MSMTLVNKQHDHTYKSNNYHYLWVPAKLLPEFCVLIYKNDKRRYLIVMFPSKSLSSNVGSLNQETASPHFKCLFLGTPVKGTGLYRALG